MANILAGEEPIKSAGRRRVRCSGRFFPNGGGAIDATLNQGKRGWTVVRTSAGLFTLTLPVRPRKVLLLGLGLQQAAAGTVRQIEWGTVTFNADNTTSIQIRCVDGAAAVQDLAANANTSISFDLEFVQDSVGG